MNKNMEQEQKLQYSKNVSVESLFERLQLKKTCAGKIGYQTPKGFTDTLKRAIYTKYTRPKSNLTLIEVQIFHINI